MRASVGHGDRANVPVALEISPFAGSVEWLHSPLHMRDPYLSRRKASSAVEKGFGRSMNGMCPLRSKILNCAPGMSLLVRIDVRGATFASKRPEITSSLSDLTVANRR